MSKSLYDKIISLNSLKKAWHYVRNDSYDDFLPDLVDYQDFAANLTENLLSIRESLLNRTYRPRPLLEIDVPKSNLAVRPGSVPEIEDRIIIMSILYMIAPLVDHRLSHVYSTRIREDYKKKDSIFKKIDEFDNVFLKYKTIKKFDIFEDWYEQWPDFAEQTIYAYEKEGYDHLVTSDIVSYFENISHDILKGYLIEYIKDQKVVNLIMDILSAWTWTGEEGHKVGIGIPQGNEFSSWLGTIYLIPLDIMLNEYSKKYQIKYIRFNDDVRIFAKKEAIAREVLFMMNTKLRDLHLNIQSGKTDIYIGNEIKDEFCDPRLEELNESLDRLEGESKEFLKKDKPIPRAIINKYRKEFLVLFRNISYDRERYGKKDLRFFRRLITAFNFIKKPDLIGRCFKELNRNPDSRLTRSIVKYFRKFPNNTQIKRDLVEFLLSPMNIFDYQTGWFISLCKYFDIYSKKLMIYVRKCVMDKSKHWFVRSQAIRLLSLHTSGTSKDLKNISKLYARESNSELKKASLLFLVRLDKRKKRKLFRRISFSQDYKINRLAKFLLSMSEDNNVCQKAINEIRDKYITDRIMIDQCFKLFMLQDIKNSNLLLDLSNAIKIRYKKTKNTNLNMIYEIMLKRIEKYIEIRKNIEEFIRKTKIE